MNRIFFLLFILLVPFAIANGQANLATPAEQARVKPLLETLNKVSEPFVAKRNSLPESKAVSDAQAALQKAVDAQTAAAQKLPEFELIKSAEAKLLDEIYKILADHKLSSREYKPTITDKGELAFVKIEQPKSQ